MTVMIHVDTPKAKVVIHFRALPGATTVACGAKARALLDKRITGGHVPRLPENREGSAPSSLHQLKTSWLLPGRRSSPSPNLP